MGKVRRLRQKYHLSKVQAAKAEKEPQETKTEKPLAAQPVGNILGSNQNIFAGLDISIDSLSKPLLQDFDARSIASTKSRKELKLEEQHLKKKTKQKLRRERFLQKLDVTQQAIKEAKEKKKRGKVPIFGDINPLRDALPTLESLFANRIKKEAKASKAKMKGIMKMKRRLKQQTMDTKLMKRILKDKQFQSNPGQTIKEYLKQKIAKER